MHSKKADRFIEATLRYLNTTRTELNTEIGIFDLDLKESARKKIENLLFEYGPDSKYAISSLISNVILELSIGKSSLGFYMLCYVGALIDLQDKHERFRVFMSMSATNIIKYSDEMVNHYLNSAKMLNYQFNDEQIKSITKILTLGHCATLSSCLISELNMNNDTLFIIATTANKMLRSLFEIKIDLNTEMPHLQQLWSDINSKIGNPNLGPGYVIGKSVFIELGKQADPITLQVVNSNWPVNMEILVESSNRILTAS